MMMIQVKDQPDHLSTTTTPMRSITTINTTPITKSIANNTLTTTTTTMNTNTINMSTNPVLIPGNVNELETNNEGYSNSQQHQQDYVQIDEELENERKTLKLHEKLKHKKWQLRRDAYVQLADIFTDKRPLNDIEDDNTYQFDLENIVPLLQTIVSEQHMLALQEGLKAIHAFLVNYMPPKGSLSLFITNLLDKLIITKTTINQLILMILDSIRNIDDNGGNIIIYEILKRLDNKNFKYLNCLLLLLNKIFQVNIDRIDSLLLRQVFKGILPMVEHTNKEIRITCLEIIKTLYSLIEESYDELQKTILCKLRMIHVKELEVLKTVQKAKIKKLIKLNDGFLKLGNDGSKKGNGNNNNNEHKVDVFNMLPDKLLELPYLKSQNDRLKKLELLNQNLMNALKDGLVFDTTKDYSLLINLLSNIIEDQNILINTEALKAIQSLMKILGKNFPQTHMKHIIMLIIEKFKGNKKTNYNSLLNQLLDDSIMMNCISLDVLLDIMVTQIETSKNYNTKMTCITWLSNNLLEICNEKKNGNNIQLEDNQAEKFIATGKFGKDQGIIIGGNKINQQRPATSGIGMNSANQHLMNFEKINRLLGNVLKRVQALVKKEPIKTRSHLQDLSDRLSIFIDSKGDISTIIHHNSKNINTSNMTLLLTELDDNKENLINPNILISDKSYDNHHHQQQQHQISTSIEDITFSNNANNTNSLNALNQKDLNNRLIMLLNEGKPHDDHLLDKLEAFLSQIEKLNMDNNIVQINQDIIIKKLWLLIKMNNTFDKKVMPQVIEQLGTILIKINRKCLKLLPKALYLQLKLLLFIGMINSTKFIEKILDSVYMICSIEQFLGCSIKILQKLDEKYYKYFMEDGRMSLLRFYIGWLIQKLEKTQSCILDHTIITQYYRVYTNFEFKNLPQIHHQLVNSLNKKVKILEEITSSAGTGTGTGTATQGEYSTSRACETPANRKFAKSTDSSKINVNRFLENEMNENSLTQTRIKAIDNELKLNFSLGLERMNMFLSSIKKKATDKSLYQMNVTPSPFLSPNSHWKRGVGREMTPLHNADQHLLYKHTNGHDSSLFYRLKADELLDLIYNICLNIQEKDLVALETILTKLKLLCNTKDNLAVLKKMLLGFCNNTNKAILEKLRDRILLIIGNYSESIDKLCVLNLFKQIFQQMNKENNGSNCGDKQQILIVFSKLTLELYINHLFQHEQITTKKLPYMVEILVYSLGIGGELKHMAEKIIKQSVNVFTKDELKKIFEIELINSAGLYRIFGEWIDTQKYFNIVKPPSSSLSSASLIYPMEKSTLAMEKSALPMEKSMLTMDKSSLHIEKLSLSTDKSSLAMDKSSVPFGKSSLPIDKPSLPIEKSPYQIRNQDEFNMKKEHNISNFSSIIKSTDAFNLNHCLGNTNNTKHDTMMAMMMHIKNSIYKQSPLPDEHMNTCIDKERLDEISNFRDYEQEEQEEGEGEEVKEENIMKNKDNSRIEGNNVDEGFNMLMNEKIDINAIKINKNMLYDATFNQNPQHNINFDFNEFKQTPNESPFPSNSNANTNEYGNPSSSSTSLMTTAYQQHNMNSKPLIEKLNMENNNSSNILGECDVVWRQKYLKEKERLQQTIELLEKANNGYLNQVTEKMELVNKLENQTKINEKLLEKFNEVANQNENLKQMTKDLQIREKELQNARGALDKFQMKNRVHVVNYLKSNFCLMADKTDKTIFLKQFQELLLISNNLELEIGDELLKIYEELNGFNEKLVFIKDLKTCIVNANVLEHLSATNHKYLIELALKLCVSETTQKEILLSGDGVTFLENNITQEIQILLDALLRYNDVHAVISNLLRTLNDNFPENFTIDLNKGQKMILKLIVKCLVRLSNNLKTLCNEEIKVFEMLLELYKIFKSHPPEQLKEDLPNIKDYDIIYRNLKMLADNLIDINPLKAREFANFLKQKSNNANVFLDYVLSYVNKYHHQANIHSSNAQQ